MILGIGIDSVEINRFIQWHTYNQKKLSRIFSEQEIEYCLRNTKKSAERFAVRFAAREAFYKAITSLDPTHTIAFLYLCKQISVEKKHQVPSIVINWNVLSHYIPSKFLPLDSFLSLTHTKTIATAYVILERQS